MRSILMIFALFAVLWAAPTFADVVAPPDEAAEVDAVVGAGGGGGAGAIEAPVADEPAVGESIKDAIDQGGAAKESFMEGRSREGVAGLITLLIFLWRRFAKGFVIGKVSSYTVGWISAVVALLANLAAELTVAQFSWPTFLVNSLVTAGEAMVMWELIGQKVLPKIFGTGAPKTEGSP